ncbi:hypothetical protein A5767_10285 [Rhodococcus sp. 852002-51564_SCH6189132-a]|uniref:hypothetical protein n=1 Tax=Rhodococcus sp. 852002-51564_SCH6189132-a TaxID=1834103 RepID=UPI0007EAA09D|nr:hypothetical protein [Rhodococcus sp. 852002-51564_SCH6189132-a]OBA35816.1 hypothetical protein A5767_10285 [Rhodococcus sp. 852002-51564_SCH6189132-a]
MTDAQTLEAPTENATIRTVRRWSPGACVWCGDTDSVEVFRNEPRCATCRKHEAVIDEARKFMGMYGLRPIGGTLQSDDEEEYEHRLAAREARRALNDIRLAEQPDPALVRKALRPRAAAITEGHTGSSAQTSTRPASATRSSSASAKPAKSAAPVRTGAVDVEEIQTRALALLDQLSAIDAQLTLVAEQNGLAARARRSDLEKQKATILRTLAALEKARLSASGS